MQDNGQFHTSGQTNRLKGQIISDEQIILFETNRLEGRIVSDEQIIRCANRTNKSADKDDFSKTICPARRISQRQYDINSHQKDKCPTICLPRWFVHPLVWKQLMITCTSQAWDDGCTLSIREPPEIQTENQYIDNRCS